MSSIKFTITDSYFRSVTTEFLADSALANLHFKLSVASHLP